jgi:hypothetical protein
MASANPSVRATLARTVSIAQVNFLPLSFVSFVTALPFTPLSLPDVYQYANDALGRPVFDSLWLAFGSSLFTFALYGVFSGARGRQVRFVECLTKGVSLALPVICQTFFLSLLAGAAYALTVVGGLIAWTLFALTPVIMIAERRGFLSATRRSCAYGFRYPWLIFGTLITFAGFDLGLLLFAEIRPDLYASWPGQLWYGISSTISLSLSVLTPSAYVAVYLAMRRNDGIDDEQSVPIFD